LRTRCPWCYLSCRWTKQAEILEATSAAPRLV
jgi:hypothetical protein